MAEFFAESLSLVGNFSGPCLIFLNGESITIKRSDKIEIAKWPYNCIRQFRAEEEAGKFSFVSGRRGPYGVAEYNFGLTTGMLSELQEALTQFTGAKFSNVAPGSGSGENPLPPPVPTTHRPVHPSPQHSMSNRHLSSSSRTDSVSSDKSFAGADRSFVSPFHSQGPRLPPRDYALPSPSRAEDGRYIMRSPIPTPKSPSTSDLGPDLTESPLKLSSISPPKLSQAAPAQPHMPTMSRDTPDHSTEAPNSLIMTSKSYETTSLTSNPKKKAKSSSALQNLSSPSENVGFSQEEESPPVPTKYVPVSNGRPQLKPKPKMLQKQQTEPAMRNADNTTPFPVTTPIYSVPTDQGAKGKRVSPYDHLNLGDRGSQQITDSSLEEKRATTVDTLQAENSQSTSMGCVDDLECSDLDFHRPRTTQQIRVRPITPEHIHLQQSRRSPINKLKKSNTISSFNDATNCPSGTYDVPKNLVEQDSVNEQTNQTSHVYSVPHKILKKEAVGEMSRPHSDIYHVPKSLKQQTVGDFSGPNTDTYNVPRNISKKEDVDEMSRPHSDIYHVPKSLKQQNVGDLSGPNTDTYNVPRNILMQQNLDELSRPPPDGYYAVPKATTDTHYHVPRSDDDSWNRQGYYHQPKPVEQVYKIPQPHTGVVSETYDYPRPANGDHSIYNTPRQPVSQTSDSNLYTNVTSSMPSGEDMYSVPRTVTASFRDVVGQDNSSQGNCEGMNDDIHGRGTSLNSPPDGGSCKNVDCTSPHDVEGKSVESLSIDGINSLPKQPHISPSDNSNGYDMYVDIAARSTNIDTPQTMHKTDNVYAEIPEDFISRRAQNLSSKKENSYVTVPTSSIPLLAAQDSAQGREPELYNKLPIRQGSKKQRELVSQGYELCLPAADSTSNNFSMMTLPTRGKRSSKSPPKIVSQEKQILDKYDIQLPAVRPARHYSESDLLDTYRVSRASPSDVNPLSSSIPTTTLQVEDEYVIVTHPDVRPKFIDIQLQGMPGPDESPPTNNGSGPPQPVDDDSPEEYQLMSAVKINRSHLPYDSPQPSLTMCGPEYIQDVQYEQVNPSDFKRCTSESSLDMEGVNLRNSYSSEQKGYHSFGSLGSVFSESSEGEVQSSVDANQSVASPAKTRMRIASGSPRDLSASLDLRNRSRTFGNILDKDSSLKATQHNYVNVTKDDTLVPTNHSDIAKVSTGTINKPPMALPRPKENSEQPAKKVSSYDEVDIDKVKGNFHPLSQSHTSH